MVLVIIYLASAYFKLSFRVDDFELLFTKDLKTAFGNYKHSDMYSPSYHQTFKFITYKIRSKFNKSILLQC